MLKLKLFISIIDKITLVKLNKNIEKAFRKHNNIIIRTYYIDMIGLFEQISEKNKINFYLK